MFNKSESSKCSFLEQTKAAREERAQEKKREAAAILLQSHVRGWLTRIRFTKKILDDFDVLLPPEGCAELRPSVQVYQNASRFLFVWKKERDKERFEKLCRYLVSSLESDSLKLSYVGVALNKEYALAWISHMKTILWKCCIYLDDLHPEYPADMCTMLLYLHTLVAFTSTNTWFILKAKHMEVLKSGMNQLCANIMGHLFNKGFYLTLKTLLIRGLGRSKVTLKHVSLSAIITLALRPLVSANFSEKLMTMFLIHILCVPGLILHLQNLAPECVSAIISHEIFGRSLDLLNLEQNTRIVFNVLEGNYALCLLANLIHLAYIQREDALRELYFPSFTFVVTRLLESCQHYVTSKQSNLTHWHPVLGWFAQETDSALMESIPHVRSQLQLLWSSPMVSALLGHVLEEAEPPESSDGVTQAVGGTGLLRRALLEHRGACHSAGRNRLGSAECSKVALVCSLYQTALATLTQLRLEVLTGLCYQDKILFSLWQFICSLGPNCGLKSFLDLLTVNTKCNAPEFQMLILFCDCMTHYVTILDDLEMYEQQKPFRLTDFVVMCSFLNNFLYKAILGNLFDVKNLNGNQLFQMAHTLLTVLYRRDCRRNYTPDNHWLIKELRVGSFVNDLEKGKKTTQVLLQKMPHIIPHDERVQLFRKYVANEKAVLGLTESACASPQATLITIHRSRIVEDGYRQLAMLPSQALKGVIRVRFINAQGLDEAGIDQDGVFKEFLEETIKRVFDPSLNLFRVTSEERLYPSPTSYMQDNHLQLFEFVGRMLGKAVYEGIVVDVPFASFFLSQLLGQQNQVLYSSMDELPSLDRELYRSLTFIKHHQGDVQELDLTFSVDEDCLGRLVTHELIPGGKAVPVTNENKINYIHLMAHFRMHTQIKDQTAAFIRGFRSIINPEWLSLFSTPELQRLISGDNVPLDLKDLRKHTQYYGGFHDSHRVVCWLWDILEKDFTNEERKLFLKFVTSCSKPPLLGFAHLEPPFSIRCVEVGDDEDTGDTIGSVIRGFFTIRKKDPQNRLPTSSTCFNLLKLPNYQKKSTLREKLRYAVSSNTGFELS
ncbi:ubiquitin-protein ligase E3B isoform X1 [Schistocerca cancellata]|uniref:ubiquitin-protein ligase E3B isoform X1 n=1 Tax=Schistocerca cancellata TaxID=274614 RepID=UPI002117F51D|nr:ubiquitin-protein ligase E3B isoform X1 [Schistocerca cancellata]